MSDKAEREIMDVLKAKQPDSRTFIQAFQYFSNSITHQNLLEVQVAQGRSDVLQIKNYFAAVNGQTVVKVTEIHLEDRVIRIVDSFSAVVHQTYTNTPIIEPIPQPSPPLSQRRNILDKRAKGGSVVEGQEDFCIRDTKNVVKNIIRLFQGWLQTHASSQLQLSSVFSAVVGGHGKFNNNLVINISRHPLLRGAFIGFCENEGEESISRSKIHDKPSHIQALRKYYRLCLDQQVVQEAGLRLADRLHQRSEIREKKQKEQQQFQIKQE